MSGIPSWAVRGAKVVCVGYERKAGEPAVVNDWGIKWRPTIGKIYTVSGTYVHESLGAFLFLAEHPEPHCFIAAGFRPLVDDEAQERDIALFKHHLTIRQPEDA